MGLRNPIELPATDGLISVVTAHSLYGEAGTIHTIVASAHESPLVIETLL